MKRVYLFCNAGMSTSMLVKKMQSSAEERSIEAHIEAKSLTEAKKNLQEADVILIGPQIRYELENVKREKGYAKAKKDMEQLVKKVISLARVARAFY